MGWEMGSMVMVLKSLGFNGTKSNLVSCKHPFLGSLNLSKGRCDTTGPSKVVDAGSAFSVLLGNVKVGLITPPPPQGQIDLGRSFRVTP